MQIRSNAESLAFLTGARLEESKTNNKLDVCCSKLQHSLYGRQFSLNLAVNMFDYLGSTISYLALAVPISSGRCDDISPAELSALIRQNTFVCLYLISTFSTLVDLSSSVT
jgi:ATP-binding cassette subfamily D (ALD) protein 4